MKRINTHHFPQDPFQESIPPRRHSMRHGPHGHHHHHRAHAYARHSHGMHHYHQQQSLMPPYASRLLRASLDSTNSLRTRDYITLPLSTEKSNVESNAPPTPAERSPSPMTPHRVTITGSDETSVSNEDNQMITNFLVNYLGRDGSLVIYILKINTNDVITGEIVTALFELFKTSYAHERTD